MPLQLPLFDVVASYNSITPFYAVPKAISSSLHGGGEGPILLDNLRCNGDEESLNNCTHNGVGEHSCSRSEIASVVCLYGENYLLLCWCSNLGTCFAIFHIQRVNVKVDRYIWLVELS